MKYKKGMVFINPHNSHCYKITEVRHKGKSFLLKIYTSDNSWADSSFDWNKSEMNEWVLFSPVLAELYGVANYE